MSGAFATAAALKAAIAERQAKFKGEELYGYSTLARNPWRNYEVERGNPVAFSRSELAMDETMLRRFKRFKMRRQIKLAHWRNVAIAVAITPIAVAVLLKAWTLSIEWVLQ